MLSPPQGLSFQQLCLPRASVSSSTVVRGSHLNEIAVSDQATLEGLTQFLTQSLDACPQIAEENQFAERSDLKEGFALHCSGPSAIR